MLTVCSRRWSCGLSAEANIDGREQVDTASTDHHADRRLRHGHLSAAALHHSLLHQRPPDPLVAKRRRIGTVRLDLRLEGDCRGDQHRKLRRQLLPLLPQWISVSTPRAYDNAACLPRPSEFDSGFVPPHVLLHVNVQVFVVADQTSISTSDCCYR